MKIDSAWRVWMTENRTSARLAFILRLLATAVSSAMSLVWAPLLLAPMGDKLYGLFLSFQMIPRLGGLGDMGITGAISIRTGQMLGRNEQERATRFLASARGLMLIVSPILAVTFFLLSPWLPGWLHFENVPGAGSLTLLFQTGALFLFVMIAGGYIYAVNTAAGNIVWLILPTLFLSQAGILGHWMLARAGSPLWLQNLSYVVSSALAVITVWWLLKVAHPPLARLRPITLDKSIGRELISTSGWVYLYTIGGLIFSATDRLLINAGIGAEAVPSYAFNYKPCELALQVVAAACIATQAKITQWIANPAEETQQRVRREVQRLCMVQALFGVVFAFGYLALDNLFISLWVGDAYRAPQALQWAFALTLAITAGGDAGIQTSALCGQNGMRTAGLSVGGTGLLNLLLSFVAMRFHSVIGIAYATVLAQTILSLFLSWYTCRHLQLSFFQWSKRSWLLPVSAVAIAALMQNYIGSKTWPRVGLLLAIFAILAVFYAKLLGFNREFLRVELSILRRYLPR